MNHPDDLLADYVDGTLLGRDLERVRSHLATCRRCREETALASAGRRAATSLPAPAIPQGLGDAAIREAEPRVQTPGRRPLPDARWRLAPRWYRWAGVAAAAAAVLVVAVIVLPNVGQGPSGTGGAERAAATASPTGPPVLELQHANYDQASLQALGLSFDAATRFSPNVPAGAQAETSASAPLPSGAPSPAGTADALACVQEAWSALRQDPVRLIAARFEGKPAYLAVYLQGPGAGEPPDLVTVTVTWAGTCRVGPSFVTPIG